MLSTYSRVTGRDTDLALPRKMAETWTAPPLHGAFLRSLTARCSQLVDWRLRARGAEICIGMNGLSHELQSPKRRTES